MEAGSAGGSSVEPNRLPTRRFNMPGFEVVAAIVLRSVEGAGAGAIGLTDLMAGSSAPAVSIDAETGSSGSAGAFARL
jgi:hypothetical protein